MNFQFKHPKFKPKLLIFTIAMLLSISAFSPTIPVQAAGSMTDEDAKGSKDIIGGPNYDRTGFLFWVCDTKGNRLSSVKAITSYGAIVDRNGKLLPASNVDLRNRDGVMAESIDTNAPWGPPYKDGAGRGTEIKQWLLETGASGHKRAASIIKQWFSEELATQWDRREAYLMFEPFYWNQIRANDENTGVWYCTTSYRWGILQGAWPGIPETGDKNIGKYTNQMYPNCLKMEPCQEIIDMGYTAPPHGGRLTNAEMASQKVGWGIGVVWNDNNSIHTYWEPNGSPGDPEPRDGKEGLCNIVKGYYEENLTTGAKVPVGEGIYTEELVTNQIVISNEPGFELVEWRISDTTSSSVDPTNWLPPGNTTPPSTTPTTVQLISPQSCVYVLLKRSYEEPPEDLDYNFKITESQITRRVHFSKPDVQGTMPKIQDYKFLFQNPAHTIECGGHTCDEGCENADCTCDLTNGGTCTTNHGKTSMKQ